jgi:hypothetical protein
MTSQTMFNSKRNRIPITRCMVILTACVVTLIGVAIRLEPDVILVRCLIACGLTGLVTHLVATLLTFIVDQNQENRTKR